MPTDPKEYLKLGDWNAYCDGCKFKFKASELKLDWKGYYKCPHCWEARHPMDLQRPPRPSQPIPWSRPTDETAGRTDVNGDPIEIATSTNPLIETTIPSGTFNSNNEDL